METSFYQKICLEEQRLLGTLESIRNLKGLYEKKQELRIKRPNVFQRHLSLDEGYKIGLNQANFFLENVVLILRHHDRPMLSKDIYEFGKLFFRGDYHKFSVQISNLAKHGRIQKEELENKGKRSRLLYSIPLKKDNIISPVD